MFGPSFKKSLIIVTLLVKIMMSLGCGDMFSKSTDPIFQKHIRAFEKEYNTVIDFPVRKASKEDIRKMVGKGKIGSCRRRLGTKAVFVHTDGLKNMTLRAITWHELSHCKFDLDHDEKEMIVQHPKNENKVSVNRSLMHPSPILELFGPFEQHYTEELRTKINNAR